jgi:hypothetical protein
MTVVAVAEGGINGAKSGSFLVNGKLGSPTTSLGPPANLDMLISQLPLRADALFHDSILTWESNQMVGTVAMRCVS